MTDGTEMQELFYAVVTAAGALIFGCLALTALATWFSSKD